MQILENYQSAIQHPVFKFITQAAANLNVDAYVIGGFVRDFILERGTAKDIDVVAIFAKFVADTCQLNVPFVSKSETVIV